MSLSPDRKLQERWDTTWLQLDELKKKRDAASKSRKEAIKAEQDEICREWKDLLLVKRRGEITDRSRIDAVLKIVKEVAMLAGMPVHVEDSGGRLETDMIAPYWKVSAFFDGGDAEFSKDLWFKFAIKTTRELFSLKFLLPWDGPITLDDRLPDSYFFDPERAYIRNVPQISREFHPRMCRHVCPFLGHLNLLINMSIQFI